jgi:hypothetical protein
MMGRAARYHLIRGGRVAAILVAMVAVFWWVRGYLEATSMVQNLLTAEPGRVPKLVSDLKGYRRWADPMLRDVLADPHAGGQLRAALALLPADPAQEEWL